LRPYIAFKTEHKQVIESFRTIPSSENIEVVLNYARTMVCPRRWSLSLDVLNILPVECVGIKHMEIIQVISTVTTSEHKDLVLIRVSSVHITWARWFSCIFEVQPLELFKIENMHVFCCKRPLAKPSSNDV